MPVSLVWRFRMLSVASVVGVDLDALEYLRRRLTKHEVQYDGELVGSSARAELERLMAEDVAELAEAYLRLARIVEQGGTA
jgi:hypothetical protein